MKMTGLIEAISNHLEDDSQEKLQISAHPNAASLLHKLMWLPSIINALFTAGIQTRFICDFTSQHWAWPEWGGFIFSLPAFVANLILYGHPTAAKFRSFFDIQDEKKKAFYLSLKEGLKACDIFFPLSSQCPDENSKNELIAEQKKCFMKEFAGVQLRATLEKDLADFLLNQAKNAPNEEITLETIKEQVKQSLKEYLGWFPTNKSSTGSLPAIPNTHSQPEEGAKNLNKIDSQLSTEEDKELDTYSEKLAQRYFKIHQLSITPDSLSPDTLIAPKMRVKRLKLAFLSIKKLRHEMQQTWNHFPDSSDCWTTQNTSDTQVWGNHIGEKYSVNGLAYTITDSFCIPLGRGNYRCKYNYDAKQIKSFTEILKEVGVEEMRTELRARKIAKKYLFQHDVLRRAAYTEFYRAQRSKNNIHQSTTLIVGSRESLYYYLAQFLGTLGAAGNSVMVLVGARKLLTFIDKFINTTIFEGTVGLAFYGLGMGVSFIASFCFTRQILIDRFREAGAKKDIASIKIDSNVNFGPDNSPDQVKDEKLREKELKAFLAVAILKALTSSFCVYFGSSDAIGILAELMGQTVNSSQRMMGSLILSLLGGIATLFCASALYFDKMDKVTARPEGLERISIFENGGRFNNSWNIIGLTGLILMCVNTFLSDYSNMGQAFGKLPIVGTKLEYFGLIFGIAGFLSVFYLNLNVLCKTGERPVELLHSRPENFWNPYPHKISLLGTTVPQINEKHIASTPTYPYTPVF